MENVGEIYIVHLANKEIFKGTLVEISNDHVTLGNVSSVSYYKDGNTLKQSLTYNYPYKDAKNNTIRFNRSSIIMEYFEA